MRRSVRPASTTLRLAFSERAGFVVVAFAFAVAMACSSAPAPLYPIYQARAGFGSATVTAIFAVYALGVIVSVLTAGHVSDWLGRRRTLLAALLLEAASCALFALSPELPSVFAGRLVCGLAIGAVGATATAWLGELHARASAHALSACSELAPTDGGPAGGGRPDRASRRSKLVATAGGDRPDRASRRSKLVATAGGGRPDRASRRSKLVATAGGGRPNRASPRSKLVATAGGDRPDRASRRSKLVATAANLGGIGSGPLVAGALATFAPAPLRLPYLIFLALLLLAAVAVAHVPETCAPRVPRPRYRPQRVAAPAHARGRYASALAGAFVALAVLSLFTSLAPSFLAQRIGEDSHLLAGLTAFLAFAAAAGGQILLAALPLRRVLRAGTLLLSLGLVLIVTAVCAPMLPLFMAGGIVAGAGAGLLFEGSLGTVVDLALPHARAEALAGLFLAAYLGVALPILGVGVASELAGAAVGVVLFVAAMLAIVLLTGRRLVGEASAAAR